MTLINTEHFLSKSNSWLQDLNTYFFMTTHGFLYKIANEIVLETISTLAIYLYSSPSRLSGHAYIVRHA